MNSTTPKQIVKDGYDRASYTYRGDQEDEKCDKYHRWLDRLIPLLAPGSPILDIGCGCGIPTAKRLAEDFSVTGVDISPVQIERARKLVPAADFICADIMEIDFAKASFDAILAFYTIFHIPAQQQRRLFSNIRNWIRGGGYIFVMLTRTTSTRIVDRWFEPNLKMYFSHKAVPIYERWLEDDGFEIIHKEMVPDIDTALPLILARAQPQNEFQLPLWNRTNLNWKLKKR